MHAAIAVAKKELRVYFCTPTAYVLLAVVAFASAQVFNGAVDLFRVGAGAASRGPALAQVNLTEAILLPVFRTTALFVIVVAPFLSMRLLAEEAHARTLELLLGAPVSSAAVVLGKYGSALGVLALALAVLLVYPVALQAFGTAGVEGGQVVDWATVGTSLLGLFVLGAMALAVGLAFSALTDSVLVAALLSLGVLFALWNAKLVALALAPPLSTLVGGLSCAERVLPFFSGQIVAADLFYYLAFAGLGLFIAERALEGHRWV